MESNNNKKYQNYTRQQPKACQSGETNRKNSDLQSHKPWPRNSRHTTTRNESSRNPKQQQQQQQSSIKTRTYADKRPRPRGGAGNAANGAACAPDDIATTGSGLASAESANSTTTGAVVTTNTHFDYELNSIYAPGSKKQNLNHLLNFHYEQHHPTGGHSVFGRAAGGGGMQRHPKSNASGGSGNGLYGKKHKYNKEQFLQANFQFVIKASAQPLHNASPDTLIDWDSIEQINIQTTEEPQCPICLYPPIAAKLTRCGHVYCWPCILHYLALSDKSWRKCPICYEAVHTRDLKSTTIIQQRQLSADDQITFHLMRRKKGSMFIEKFKSSAAIVEYYPQLSADDGTKLFSKFVIANDSDVLQIIERERHELVVDEDPSCPEYVFIQQALDLLSERREKLSGIVEKQEKTVSQVDISQSIDISLVENNDAILDASASSTSMEETTVSGQEIVTTLDAADTTTKYYYFYQCEDGQNIFLHPLNVKMLQACYNTLDCAPLIINARIVQKEQHSMDEEHRRKFTCLGHLPLTCQFSVVEVDLQPPIVTEDVLKLFKDDVIARQKERQRRAREERKREKHIEQINDRQMGKLIASAANLNLNSSHEFPTCGFEEPLGGATIMDSNPGTSASSTNSMPMLTNNRQVSYSAIAVTGGGSPKKEYWPTLASPSTNAGNYYQELSVWGRPSTAGGTAGRKSTVSETSHDSDAGNNDVEGAFFSPLQTTLSDVLAEAMATQKKQKPMTTVATGAIAAGGNKKNKKAKKMQPLFTTGMSYNGN